MIEVRQNSDGSIDEVVHKFSCCNVHLEDLGNGNWMLVLEAHGDVHHRLHVTITRKRAFVYESENCEIRCTDQHAVAPAKEP